MEFNIPPRTEWKGEDKSSVRVVVGRGTGKEHTPIKYNDLRHRIKQYHPLRPSATAMELDRECDIASDIFSYVIYHEFGIPRTKTAGNIYCTKRETKIENHLFNVVPSGYLADIDSPVIIDGTAKQYADEGAVTVEIFGPQDSIPLIQVVKEDDWQFEYYSF